MTRGALLLLVLPGLVGCARTEMVDLKSISSSQLTRCEQVVDAPVPMQGLLRQVSARSCPAGDDARDWQRID